MKRQWRMKDMCDNCPFASSGPGFALRKSLARGRFSEIKRDLQNNKHFLCHKTTTETGNGKNLVCAGAIAYQESIGTSSNLQRVMERLDWIYGRKDTR